MGSPLQTAPWRCKALRDSLCILRRRQCLDSGLPRGNQGMMSQGLLDGDTWWKRFLSLQNSPHGPFSSQEIFCCSKSPEEHEQTSAHDPFPPCSLPPRTGCHRQMDTLILGAWVVTSVKESKSCSGFGGRNWLMCWNNEADFHTTVQISAMRAVGLQISEL